MATSKIAVTEGAGKNLATNSISEDAVTKELSRVIRNNSSGTELGNTTNPDVVSQAAASVPAATTMQNAVSASANGTALTVTGYATAIINITSSPAMSGGTIVNFEASTDGSEWQTILAHQIGQQGSQVLTTSTDGDYRINCSGFASIRARISAYSAGTVTVKGYVSPVAGVPSTIGIAGSSDTAQTDSTQTTSIGSFVKGFVKILNDVWDSTNHWLKVLRVKKDTFAAPVAFTITLASLTASSTAGRQSTLITSNTAESALVSVKVKTGTTPTVNTLISVYLIRGDGTQNDDGAGASDAAFTPVNATLLGNILNNSASTGQTFTQTFDTKFAGSLGPTFGIAIVNNTGAALDATAGSHLAEYTLIS